MKISSIFDKSVKYFGNYIMPKCEYCEFGNRSKENSKVLCSKNGLVPPDYSCVFTFEKSTSKTTKHRRRRLNLISSCRNPTGVL